MKKTLAVLSTTVMLGLGNVVAIPAVKADTLQQNIAKANTNISQAKDGLAAAIEQMNRVNTAIADNNNKVVDTQNKISEKNNEINQLQGQITDLKDKMEKRNEILKKRAQSFQEAGTTVNYIDVVMGASSFRDLVDRVGAVAQLVEADNSLLTQQQADKQSLEEKQATVQKTLDDLNAMKTDLDGMQAELADQKAQQAAQQAAFQQQQQDGNNQLAALMAQQEQAAAAQINAGVSEVKQNAGSSNKTSSVSALSVAPTTTAASGSLSTVIQAGYKYIGHSVYVFGGGRTASDIARGYFDCSGFVHWAFAQAGIGVGSSTDSLLGAGSRVSASNIQPGDLVFFNTYKTNGHVGIYIGGGNFIGSQSSTGVAVANMSGGYWAQHFAGVVVRVR
ncbi:NlpC/P60 family protein [Neobacillus sp. PS3-12]|uniref:C40 family peptidase n=1 Tax=Neobacillus sp. PS3-12 TaxID=3070677 RepID=UPI0027E1CE2D|nr:NlpC/P60 family protein [Neobacillus sp. PS3-12]WML51800.1 NlpC/P60 family protein [Neobacillus sp. PS3-12]